MTQQRAVILVDCESLGLLGPPMHPACEVAWINAMTGEWGRFLPRVSTDALRRAEPEALRINGYVERLAGQPTDDGREAVRLHRQLQGQTLAGSKPDFDAALLGDLFARADSVAAFDVGELGPPGPSRPMRLRQPWHHQLASLGSYAAGAFGLPMSQIPSQRHVCERLGVENTAPHTALGDCQALLECLYRLGAVRRPDEVGGAA